MSLLALDAGWDSLPVETMPGVSVQVAPITFEYYTMADSASEPTQFLGWGMQSLDSTGRSLTPHAP